ncbi:MAG: LysR family transcriptional regulator [Roseomonas sp.]|nr:LysR family transcriptional regulator [Roseomonas sp.]
MKRIDPHPDDLRAVLAVVETGAFGRAALTLGLSQPALSRRVMRAEAALGGALLERGGHGAVPTSLGRDSLPALQRALRAFDDAVDAAREPRGGRRPQLSIACIQTAAFALMPGPLARLSRAIPEIRVRLLDLSAREGLRALLRGECDLAVNILPTHEPDLQEEPLLDDPFRLVVPTGHRFAEQGQARWAELRGERLIVAARGAVNHGLVRGAIEEAHRGEPGQPRWWLEVSHLSTAIEFAGAGLGIAAVPELALTGAWPNVTAVPLREPEVVRHVGLAWRRTSPLPPAARRLAELLRDEARRRHDSLRTGQCHVV